MNEDIPSVKSYVVTFGLLLALLALTIGLAYLDLGLFNPLLALFIAALKAFLILRTFMHLKSSGGLMRLTAAVGVLWLMILIALSLADYATRP